MEVKAYAYGGKHCGCVALVSAPRCLILAFASASSINAAHLNEHSALVKIRKTEEAKKITLELR